MAGVSLDPMPNLSPELQKAFQSAMQAERRPIQLLETKKENLEQKVQLLNDVITKVENTKKLLPNLNGPVAIRELMVATTDDKILSGTADKTRAEPGTHNIEIMQLATQATAISNAFEDRDQTKVGTGYFTFSTATGETKEVFVDNENATLDGLARLINSAGMGVHANVISDATHPDEPYRLLLTADGTGANKDVQYPDFYFIDGDQELEFEEQRPAANARLRYEGFEIESPTNELKDLIAGVTLNLRGTTDLGRPATVTVQQDAPRTILKVKDLVERLNQVFSFIQNQNRMDEKTPTAKTLGGDYGIRVAESRLRSALQQNFLFDNGKQVKSLGDLGIQFNKNGTLEFDEKKLEHQLNANFDEVVDLLAGDGISYGVVPRLSTALNSISGPASGVLSNQKQNLGTRLKDIEKSLEAKEKLAERKQEALKNKMIKAQNAITAIQNQSALITGGGATSMSPLTSLLGG